MEIKNILEKLEIPEEERVNAEKFIVTIASIDLMDALKFKKNLEYYDVVLTKCGDLKRYTTNTEEQNIILKRLQYLKDNGIVLNPEDKKIVFSATAWYNSYPDVDLRTVIPDVLMDRTIVKDDILNILDVDANVGLTDSSYEDYIRLESIATNVLEAIGEEMTPEISNNLVKLVSKNLGYVDEQLILAALVYRQNRTRDDIENITNAIINVTDSYRREEVTR